MEQSLKRISLLIKEKQYQELAGQGLNVSGLIRDLVDDYLSHHKVTVAVSQETRQLYDRIVANTGSTDADVERYLKAALKELLRDKIKEMEELESKAFGEDES